MANCFSRIIALVCLAGISACMERSTSVIAPSVYIQIIDRGQADGILIRTPNEEWIIIDAGSNKQQAEAMLNEWGVDKVALAIVSHRHEDHLGGMDEVLEEFHVERFMGVMDDCEETSLDDDVRAVINTKNISVR